GQAGGGRPRVHRQAPRQAEPARRSGSVRVMGDATVQAIVDGMIRFNPREMHPRAVEHLLRDLSFPNPEYISRVRYGRWVGATPEEISLLEEQDGLATVPRGAVALVREALRAAGQELAFVDRRPVCPEARYALGFELRRYQE